MFTVEGIVGDIVYIELPQIGKKVELGNEVSVIESVKAQGPKDIGKVMGTIKKKYSEVLDFSKVGSLVKEMLK